MPIRLKRNAVVVFGLAALLVFAKYNLTRLMMTPLGQDPCDAVGVFAFTIVILIPLVSLVRAFGPYRKGPASAAQCLHVIRWQQEAVLAIFITLAADTYAGKDGLGNLATWRGQGCASTEIHFGDVV